MPASAILKVDAPPQRLFLGSPKRICGNGLVGITWQKRAPTRPFPFRSKKGNHQNQVQISHPKRCLFCTRIIKFPKRRVTAVLTFPS